MGRSSPRSPCVARNSGRRRPSPDPARQPVGLRDISPPGGLQKPGDGSGSCCPLALVSAETKGHDGAVLPRVLAAAATAWSAVYLVAYLWVIDAQDGAVAWWYVVLMVLAALSFALGALGTWPRAAPAVGLATSGLAMLIALLSLGALLAPAVVAAAIALVVTRPGANTPPATGEPQPSQQRGVSR
jgi:hypothetical protein